MDRWLMIIIVMFMLLLYIRPFNNERLEPPRIIEQPSDVTVTNSDQGATLTCKADGSPRPTIEWYKDGEKVKIGRTKSLIAQDTLFFFRVVQSEKDSEDLTDSNTGIYWCVARNSVGKVVSRKATLSLISPPRIVVSHRSVNTNVSNSIKIDCLVSGSPRPLVFWIREGSNDLLMTNTVHQNIRIANNNSLLITKVNKQNQGIYTCAATSPSGSTMNRTFISVTAILANPPPIIRVGPVDQVVREDSGAMLPCEVASTTPSSVKWLFNANPILDVEPFRFLLLNSGTLQIDSIKETDSGLYTCLAENENGITKWTANVTVKSPLESDIIFSKNNDLAYRSLSPSQPIVVNVTHQSVTLTWLYERIDLVDTFLLEYYSSLTPDRWIRVEEKIVGTRYVVGGLTPETSYVFIVRAKSEHGLGPPSPTSDEIFTVPSFGLFLNPELNEARHILNSFNYVLKASSTSTINSTSLALSIDSKSDSPFVDSYDVRYRLSDSVNNSSSSSLSTFNLISLPRSDASEIILTGLTPFSEYNVFVIPKYKMLHGQPSNLVLKKTSEDHPSLFPENIRIKVLNKSSASISWSHLDRRSWNGIPKGYLLRVYSEISGDHHVFHLTPITSSIILNNLTTSDTYNVEIAAYTSAGPGPYSPSALMRVEPGYIYLSDSRNAPFLHGNSSNALVIIAKDPILLAICVLIIILIAFMLLFILARRHLGLRKAVGSYITIKMNKCENFEKQATGNIGNLNGNLNFSLNKKSWFPEGNTVEPLVGMGSLYPESSSVKLYPSNQPSRSHSSIPCNSNGKSCEDVAFSRRYSQEDDFYAEVEGHTSLVTFGKNSLTQQPPPLPLATTSSEIEPYATTNLIINTYQKINYAQPVSGNSSIKSKISSSDYHHSSQQHLRPLTNGRTTGINSLTTDKYEKNDVGEAVFRNTIVGMLKKRHPSSEQSSSNHINQNDGMLAQPLISSSNQYELMAEKETSRLNELFQLRRENILQSDDDEIVVKKMSDSFDRKSCYGDEDPIYSTPYIDAPRNSPYYYQDKVTLPTTSNYSTSSLLLNRKKMSDNRSSGGEYGHKRHERHVELTSHDNFGGRNVDSTDHHINSGSYCYSGSLPRQTSRENRKTSKIHLFSNPLVEHRMELLENDHHHKHLSNNPFTNHKPSRHTDNMSGDAKNYDCDISSPTSTATELLDDCNRNDDNLCKQPYQRYARDEGDCEDSSEYEELTDSIVNGYRKKSLVFPSTNNDLLLSKKHSDTLKEQIFRFNENSFSIEPSCTNES